MIIGRVIRVGAERRNYFVMTGCTLMLAKESLYLNTLSIIIQVKYQMITYNIAYNLRCLL